MRNNKIYNKDYVFRLLKQGKVELERVKTTINGSRYMVFTILDTQMRGQYKM